MLSVQILNGIAWTPIIFRVEVLNEIYIMYDFSIINVGPVWAASKQETQDSGFWAIQLSAWGLGQNGSITLRKVQNSQMFHYLIKSILHWLPLMFVTNTDLPF